MTFCCQRFCWKQRSFRQKFSCDLIFKAGLKFMIQWLNCEGAGSEVKCSSFITDYRGRIGLSLLDEVTVTVFGGCS